MKIAIAGYGVEGKASYDYWSKDPQNQLTIVDGAEHPFDVPEGVPTVTGPDAFKQLNGYDLVIRTPGLNPQHITTDGKIWSITNEFFAKCPAPIIGITGSKGKGTTASLIASILKAAGKTVHLVGNIGVPAIQALDDIATDDIVVYELSSFQLWDVEYSPQTAVVLFIEQEHLDVHPTMEDYVAAKANIARYQTSKDILIYDAGNTYVQAIASQSEAIKIGYPSTLTTHVKDGYFWNGEQKLCSVDNLQLPGEHNVQNAIAAIDAVWQYVQDGQVIGKGLADFKGLEHRLKIVGKVGDITYVDDSIATTPGSAIAALQSFDGPKAIILGGSSKGSDFTELAQELLRHDVYALLIGKEAAAIAAACDTAEFSKYRVIEYTDMDTLVQQATASLNSRGTVLLSPAAASFGLFKNYADRGDQFIAAVQRLS